MSNWCVCGCYCGGNPYLCDRLGASPCRYCGCSSIQKQEEDNTEMLQKSGSSSQKTDSRNINYFKLDNVPPSGGVKATIKGVRNEKTRFGDYRIKLVAAGVVYYWDVKLSWPVSDKLIDLFGPDESKWTDREFLAVQEHDDFAGRNYIGVREITEKKSR